MNKLLGESECIGLTFLFDIFYICDLGVLLKKEQHQNTSLFCYEQNKVAAGV